MVVGINLERFRCSKLGSGRTYATSHLLFKVTDTPLRTGLRTLQSGQIGAVCPGEVEGQPVGSRAFSKGVLTEVGRLCQGVFDGVLRVDVGVIP